MFWRLNLSHVAPQRRCAPAQQVAAARNGGEFAVAARWHRFVLAQATAAGLAAASSGAILRRKWCVDRV
jgi:hypothetical protein